MKNKRLDYHVDEQSKKDNGTISIGSGNWGLFAMLSDKQVTQMCSVEA
jgi:hypothetical protein